MYIKLRIESLSKPKIGTHFIQLSYWHQKHKNSQKTRITLSKSKKKNVPKFQNLDIVLVSCNLIERKYQQNSGVSYTFSPCILFEIKQHHNF